VGVGREGGGGRGAVGEEGLTQRRRGRREGGWGAGRSAAGGLGAKEMLPPLAGRKNAAWAVRWKFVVIPNDIVGSGGILSPGNGGAGGVCHKRTLKKHKRRSDSRGKK
jgi:hypothetical protein